MGWIGLQKIFDDIANPFDRVGGDARFARRKEFGAGCGQVGDHSGSLGSVVEQGFESSGKVLGSEAVVEQFGDDPAAGDEVDHGDREVAVGVERGGDLRRIANEAFSEGEGEFRDAVDDDEWVPDGEGEDGCGATGDDSGSGMVEGSSGVRNDVRYFPS